MKMYNTKIQLWKEYHAYLQMKKIHQNANISYLWIMQLWVVFFSVLLCISQIFYNDKVLFLKMRKKCFFF